MRERNFTALGYRQQSVTTAAGFDDIPSGARYAQVVTDAAVRWRDDGTDPDAATGMPLAADQELWYDGANLAGIVFVAESGTATLDVSFYG